MLTPFDKAIVAAVMACVTVGSFFYHPLADANLQAGIAAALTPLVVFLIPNKS